MIELINEIDRLSYELTKAQRELNAKAREENITGVLDNVTFQLSKYDARYPNLAGAIRYDRKGRFYPGDPISTSRLKSVYVKDGRTYAQTTYSLYELIGFDPSDIPEDFKYAFEDV
jgi:hypothetical protein